VLRQFAARISLRLFEANCGEAAMERLQRRQKKKKNLLPRHSWSCRG